MITTRIQQMKLYLIATGLCFVAGVVTGREPPEFFKNTYPEHALSARLEADEVLFGEKAEIDEKTRILISLAVAAQVPCNYCVYIHQKQAKAAGISEGELREAVAIAARIRHWSTVLNGMGYDFKAFKSEVDQMLKSSE